MTHTTRHTRPFLRMKSGDTAPPITDQLLDLDDEPIDLTAAAGVDHVRFQMEFATNDTLVVDSEATITDPEAGEVEYQFAPSDVERTGRHRAEWIVAYTDGRERSYPRHDHRLIDLLEPIARDATTEGT